MTTPAPGSRTVLLTGASSGIGRESALRFARAGDRVVAVARHAPALEELAAAHPGIEVETCDLRDAAARAALVERVLARHPRVDVLVNNAGIGVLGLLHEHAEHDLARVYETNVLAVADLTRMLLPQMLARRSGSVVMLSSVAAWLSGPPATVYASSKFAVEGLVQGLRRETRGTGVHVHSIHPGPISTGFLSRTADRSPQPGDPQVPDAPGFPVAWVARAVVDVAGAARPRTRSVPRVMGLTRFAQVPPVGLAIDVATGLLRERLVRGARTLEAPRAEQLPARGA